ncbi:hypothetical protein BLA29_014627, partial [Euroglyphus maynei]
VCLYDYYGDGRGGVNEKRFIHSICPVVLKVFRMFFRVTTAAAMAKSKFFPLFWVPCHHQVGE